MNRIPSGLAELDKLVDGGFPQNTCILISGGPGTGKTLFGLNFVENRVDPGEKSCYISFNEDAGGIIQAGEGTGLEIEKTAIKHMDLLEDVSIVDFIKTIESYPELDRLVIDSINKLLLFSKDKADYRNQLYRMVRYLRKNVKASLLICETDGDDMDTGNGEAFECDGVIGLSFLELEEKPMRTLQIHKMRYTAIEPKVAHELVIESKGLKLSKRKVI
jgi:KaiC/GvpD/RAD55 family RecA-like ATPase